MASSGATDVWSKQVEKNEQISEKRGVAIHSSFPPRPSVKWLRSEDCWAAASSAIRFCIVSGWIEVVKDRQRDGVSRVVISGTSSRSERGFLFHSRCRSVQSGWGDPPHLAHFKVSLHSYWWMFGVPDDWWHSKWFQSDLWRQFCCKWNLEISETRSLLSLFVFSYTWYLVSKDNS